MRKAIFLLILFSMTYSSAQVVLTDDGLNVGLVLSGGGAKGLAHIGALKVIEEAGVEIDYIGGTSMGAIIGALYASGYSAHELDSIFRKTNLETLIQDNLPRGAKTFYEKEDSETYILTLPFNNFKISVPSSFYGGQNIYNELVRLLYHVKDVNDFNNLPIPFLCIATDVETGEEVVLNKGYLPEAVMASGTLPSLFAPEIIDNKLLIDGGVVNNYPLENVYEMGADVTIGVDVQHGLSNREALKSATEVLLQINNFHTVESMKKKSRKTDIYIRPNIADYSVLDFEKRDTLIRLGEEAAKKSFEELKSLSKYQKKRQTQRKPIKATDEIVINKLVLTGTSENYSRGYVKGKLRFDLDEKITFDKLQQGINNLTTTKNFKTIRYQLRSNEGGEELIMPLEENENKTFIRLGAHYNDLYKSAALVNFTQKNFLAKDDVSSLDLIIGDNLRYNLSYYVDRGSYWSFGFNSRFNNFDAEIDIDVIQSNFEVPNGENVNNINLGVTDVTNQLYIQSVLQEEFGFIAGIEHKFLKYSTRTLGQLVNENQEPFPVIEVDGRTNFERSSFYSAFSQLTLDTYDDKYFPSSGLYFKGDFHYYILSSDFNNNFRDFSVTKARMGGAFSIFNRLSLNLETEGGFKLGTSNVTTFDFILGGYGANLINNFIPFVGYDFLSLPGNSYVKAYGRLDWECFPKNHVLFSANVANVADDLFRTGEWFSSPSFSGYGVGYGLESIFGPVEVTYSWSPQLNSGNFFFSVGYRF